MNSAKELLVIEHRINTVEQLKKVPKHRGVEIDIRDYNGDLRLTHNPFSSGERLEDFLEHYDHKFIIFNVKCAGLERRILDLAQKHHIEDFFLLDIENPSLVNLSRAGMKKIAVRFSDFEDINFALGFAGLVEWVWVDCFEKIPLNQRTYATLARHFKICLVSPEMQHHPEDWIEKFRRDFKDMPIDAVCTDLPLLWEKTI